MKFKSLILRLRSIKLVEVPYRVYQLFVAFFIDPLSKVLFKILSINSSFENIKLAESDHIDLTKRSTLGYQILQLEIDDIFSISDWRRDYKNGISSDLKYYFLLDKQCYKEYGDIKYVWELSRFYHLPALAIETVQKDDVRLAQKIQEQLKKWIRENPYLMSINWKSGIEVGIRSINWCLAISILNEHKFLNDDFKKLYKRSIWQHAFYLRFHLSKYSSANNHLIAELVGLMFLGIHLNSFIGRRWYNFAFKMLTEQVEQQFAEDGGSKEQAIHYHALTLDLYQIALKFANTQNTSIPDKLIEKVDEAGFFLTSYLENMKEVVEFGDSDSSYVLYNPFDNDFNHYTSVVNTHKQRLNINPGEFHSDFRNQLLVNEETKEYNRRYSLQNNQDFSCHYFKDSGYILMEGERTKLIFDIGPLGMGKTAAHGHADALQFIYFIDGLPVLVDPGTYQYHRRKKKWREYFRSTSAHNTISLNGMSQARPLGRMNWGERYYTVLKQLEEDEQFITVTAEHNGYRQQGVDALHERSIKINKLDNSFLVIDKLTSKEECAYDFNLHCHPSLPKVKLVDNELEIKVKDSCTVTLQNNKFNKANLFKANEVLPMGWYSPRFDELVPAFSLNLKGKISGTEILCTEVLIK